MYFIVNARHIDSRVDRTTDQQHLVTYEVSQSEQQAYGNNTPPTNVKKVTINVLYYLLIWTLSQILK